MCPICERRAERKAAIVDMLKSADVATAEDMAVHLRVSVRTIYRDIGALRVDGYRILGEASMGYALRGREVIHGR